MPWSTSNGISTATGAGRPLFIVRLKGFADPHLAEYPGADIGIAELGNCIAGRATSLLSEGGIDANIAPPVLLQGAGSRVSTAGIQRLVVPLGTDLGVIEAQLAIKGR